MTPPRHAAGVLVLSCVLWGMTWIPLRHFAAHGLSGLALTLLTYGLIGAIALPWLLLRRAAWRSQWPLVVAAGIFGGLANACFVTTMMHGEVARAMLLFYLAPLWGVLGGSLLLKEPLTRTRAAACACALGGALLVLGGPGVLMAAPGLLDLLAVGAGLFFAGQNLAARAAHTVPVSIKTLSGFAGCTLVAAILLPLDPGSAPAPAPGLALELLAFAFAWLAIAMWTQVYGVSHLEAGRAAVLVIVELVVAVATAMLFAGERLPPSGWLGAALIVVAAILESRPAASRAGSLKESPA